MKRLVLLGVISATGAWAQGNLVVSPAVQHIALAHKIFQSWPNAGLAPETRALIAESWRETNTMQFPTYPRIPQTVSLRFVSKGAGIRKVAGLILVVRLPNLRKSKH